MPSKASTALSTLFNALHRDFVGTVLKVFSPAAWKRLIAAVQNPDAAGLKVDRPWQGDDVLRQRRYTSYKEYVDHQASKLTLVHGHLDEREEKAYASFRTRFETCSELSDKRVVVCLAARLGTEVRALQDLGHFAVGIDLEPGEKNALVLYGDFHDLAFKEDSVDAVYCNALDHVYDLDKVLVEVKRILTPGGIFVTDLVNGYEEGHTADNFDCTHWRTAEEFAVIIGQKSGLKMATMRNLADVGEPSWNQTVFIKT